MHLFVKLTGAFNISVMHAPLPPLPPGVQRVCTELLLTQIPSVL